MRATPETILKVLLLLAAFATAPLLAAGAEDWPQFRGPKSDGISKETGLLKTWPASGPRVLWRAPLGHGFSGMAVVDGRVFTQFSKDGDEFLIALDAATGAERWRYRTDDERPDSFGDGPRSTPLVDGTLVYAVSAYGKLHAVHAASGQRVWSHDLVAELGARLPNWGVAAAPILVGDRLLFNAGGPNGKTLAAFDKASGKLLWTAEDDIAGYSTPIAFTVDGVEGVVFLTGTQLMIVRPSDGATLWKRPWKTDYDINAAAPIFVPPNRLFVSTGYDVGATLFELRGSGGKLTVSEVWKARNMKNQFSSTIYHGGHFYGFDNTALKCIDGATGEDRWRKSGFGHGSLFYADGHLVVLGDRGRLALVAATPESYQEKASAQVLSGKHWTVPTLSGGRLYLRNEAELVALDVAAGR